MAYKNGDVISQESDGFGYAVVMEDGLLILDPVDGPTFMKYGEKDIDPQDPIFQADAYTREEVDLDENTFLVFRKDL